MSRLVFDIETNGFLDALTTIHCIGIKDIDTGKAKAYGPKEIDAALNRLANADLVVGHNVIGFDIPAIRKLLPNWKPKFVRDTLVLTRLFWPHIKDSDYKRKRLPKKLIGSHSLRAWGYRIGEYKDDYSGDFSEWTQELQDYMMQDVEVTYTLWHRAQREADTWDVPIDDANPPPKKDCVALEHRVADLCYRVEEHGFPFDSEAAANLAAKLTKRAEELNDELQKAFPPIEKTEIFIPKVNNKTRGYVKGEPFLKKWEVPFNPSSRQQVGARLKALGWKPKAFGADGHPTVDETVLDSLPYPEAKLLSEHYTILKRLGQVANGRQAWFRHAINGRIHGRIQPGGAHTGRMTHSSPNLAQVPGNHAPYGVECRSCFTAVPGQVLVGCDADGLELRDLAGYMAIYDDGEYIKTVLEGDKAQGTDMHTLNAKAIGCDRDTAKVFFYAMIYGAGDGKLGEIIGNARKGKAARARLMESVPALAALIKAVKRKIKRKGFIVGLDGRRLYARSENAALNTLLQSAGAVQMKRALVLLDESTKGLSYAILGLIHDEWQMSVVEESADQLGKTAAQAIRDAGEFYSFRCPLDAQYQKGTNWSETH